MPAGEPERFEAVFREHYDAVLRYALARAGHEEALEAAADTFLVAWRRRSELPERPLPWLLAVTRRTLADRRRSSRRRSRLTDRVALYRLDDIAAPDPAEDVAERTVLLDAFRQLPDADREVLELVAWDGLTPADAAAVVGCSPATFAVRVWRARQRLERAMTRHNEQPATSLDISPMEEIR